MVTETNCLSTVLLNQQLQCDISYVIICASAYVFSLKAYLMASVADPQLQLQQDVTGGNVSGVVTGLDVLSQYRDIFVLK